MDELLNGLTGEIVGLADFLATSRTIEREIGRLDRAIADNKEEGKDLKLAREKAVKDLRAHVRDVGTLPASTTRRTGRRR